MLEARRARWSEKLLGHGPNLWTHATGTSLRSSNAARFAKPDRDVFLGHVLVPLDTHDGAE